jgi:uncharacterized protein (DUF2062 family)
MRQKLKDHFAKLFRIEDSPVSIARGFAAGMFIGFSPFYGLKAVLTLLTAWLLRLNKISALAGFCVHDIILPFAPVVIFFQYELGCALLGFPSHEKVTLETLTGGGVFFLWKLALKESAPLALGSFLSSGALALVSYFIVRRAAERYHVFRSAKETSKMGGGS